MTQKSLSSFFGGGKSDPKPAVLKKENVKSPKSQNDSHRIQHISSKNQQPILKPIADSNETVVNPNEYDPAKEDYHPINDACWKANDPVPFIALCKTFSAIESVSSRLKIISILTNYFHSVIRLSPENIVPSIYLCLNQIGPSYEGKELGIGESSIITVLVDATGKKAEEIKKAMSKYADLGILAEKYKTSQNTMFKHQPLNVLDVFNKLKEIGEISGQSSNTHKKSKILGLVAAAKDCEVRYLIRSLQKKLRIGLAEQSILVALAHAFLAYESPIGCVQPKEELEIAALAVKSAFCELPNYSIVVDSLLKTGLSDLHKTCTIRPGIPVKPMLANSSKSVSEILKRFEDVKICCEYKYDGERAQIHCDKDGVISIFSRNQENSTTKFPDIVKLGSTISKSKVSFILDSEVVAYDVENKRILPFQQLTTRKRKNVEQHDIKIQVCIFVFDLIYYDDETLIRENYIRRREILHENFAEIPGKFLFAAYKDINNIEEIQQCLDDAVKANCEGLIIKTLDKSATYEIAKRSHNWRKLKKDYLDNVGDSLDLVVIGGYFGVGKRSGVYGGYLLACYDPDEEEYQSICKIGTGFSDEDLKEQFKYFSNILINNPKTSYKYPESLAPNHWFDSTTVWQVRAADLSLSPIHRAAFGKIDPDKGISLRFPRFEKVRDDKLPEQATDIYQIMEMYRNQMKNAPQSHLNSELSNEE